MEMIEFLRDMQPKVEQQNIEMGWRDKPRSFAQDLILIHTEISEAAEGLRKNLMDDKLPHYPMVFVEMADVIIRGLDTLSKHNEVWASNHSVAVSTSTSVSLINMHVFISEAWLHQGDALAMYQLQRCVIAAYKITEQAGYPIQKIVMEKMEYNRTRPDHQRENRKKLGGKEW